MSPAEMTTENLVIPGYPEMEGVTFIPFPKPFHSWINVNGGSNYVVVQKNS
jgi:hypothetical protein